ncbi:LacI family transcriptional regulator [Microtetraspora sp. NBRC 13810]|uniref:LacI family DNA-binding transcriptional regulator n=1 Tax=Microtetraspora sp. NBRC 13810 TaxID=3030990 RepID=UPI0024A5C05C|nr:LacI family DNA-binding transcriptional regulator [Microtetraspora sp. NBRC 13810]GLW11707.1 LacI family transcriptional regulator [Microtetraspora sp. NBRC 13810]
MNAQKRRKPTQIDIARLAGVSQSTVSLVLNEDPARSQIPAATRQRVTDAIRELGYTANPAARSLKGGRNHLLGLYTFETVFPLDQRDFYYPFLLGVEEEAAERGYDLVLFTSAGSDGRSIYAGGVNRLGVADGCVLLGRHIRRDDLERLVGEDFPVVFIGRRGVEELSFVAADYAAATREVVLKLAGLGHRDLLYLAAPEDSEPSQDRAEGYRQGLAETGLAHDERVVEPGEITADRLTEWLAGGVTAIVVEPTEDDRVAVALQEAAGRARIDIPGDLSVVLLGDPPSWSASPRDWTGFSIPRTEMARAAVEMLIDLLEDRPARRTLFLPCPPVEGDSVAPPRATGGDRPW